jgi:hypothetical protein
MEKRSIKDILGQLGEELDKTVDQVPTFFKKIEVELKEFSEKAPDFFEENIKKPFEETKDTIFSEMEKTVSELKENFNKYKYIGKINLDSVDDLDFKVKIDKSSGTVSVEIDEYGISKVHSITVSSDIYKIGKTLVYLDKDLKEITIEIPKKEFLIKG